MWDGTCLHSLCWGWNLHTFNPIKLVKCDFIAFAITWFCNLYASQWKTIAMKDRNCNGGISGLFSSAIPCLFFPPFHTFSCCSSTCRLVTFPSVEFPGLNFGKGSLSFALLAHTYIHFLCFNYWVRHLSTFSSLLVFFPVALSQCL